MSIENDLLAESEESGGEGAGWMATFADMMTLLLTFFVLLLSFATMDITKFQMMLGSVKDALGVQYEHPGQVEAVSTHPIQFNEKESGASPIVIDDVALQLVRKIISDRGLNDIMEVEVSERGLVIRVRGTILYDLGEASLRTESRAVLDGIAAVAKVLPHPLLIEGHTDDLPIHTSRFPSNWELSAARAIAAMRYLAQVGVESSRLGVAGYADMRPLAPNDSEENRATNRRVEFVFVAEAKGGGDDPRAQAGQTQVESARTPGAVTPEGKK